MTNKEEFINLLEFLDFEKESDDDTSFVYIKFYSNRQIRFLFIHDNDLVLVTFIYDDNDTLNSSDYMPIVIALEAFKISFKHDIRQKKISKLLLK